jgi:hypothetical protein
MHSLDASWEICENRNRVIVLICNVRLPITALSLDPPNSTASDTELPGPLYEA